MEKTKRAPRDVMHDLLGRLGEDKITLDEFLRRIKECGLTVDDIDRYLDGSL